MCFRRRGRQPLAASWSETNRDHPAKCRQRISAEQPPTSSIRPCVWSVRGKSPPAAMQRLVRWGVGFSGHTPLKTLSPDSASRIPPTNCLSRDRESRAMYRCHPDIQSSRCLNKRVSSLPRMMQNQLRGPAVFPASRSPSRTDRSLDLSATARFEQRFELRIHAYVMKQTDVSLASVSKTEVVAEEEPCHNHNSRHPGRLRPPLRERQRSIRAELRRLW